MLRIPFEQLRNEFLRVLIKLNFKTEKAEAIADIFASNSRDGIYSHGLNRFPGFVEYVKEGFIDKDADPVLEENWGVIERWNGNLGPGMLNAAKAMGRAAELAHQNGIGCVALRNTNHWMRGGTYGLQAAEEGCIGICFTNTIANMPPWGGTEPRLGNNPLIIAIPKKGGHIVLDMAVSQYAFGKLNTYRLQGKQLPFDGGYDKNGRLTKDPAAIMESLRPLPIGLWKGSGLSLVLDMLAVVLSGGKSTGAVSASGKEYGVSQVFLCIYKDNEEEREQLLNEILSYTKTSAIAEEKTVITYPGENMLKTRLENVEKGVPVDAGLWNELQGL